MSIFIIYDRINEKQLITMSDYDDISRSRTYYDFYHCLNRWPAGAARVKHPPVRFRNETNKNLKIVIPVQYYIVAYKCPTFAVDSYVEVVQVQMSTTP